MIDLSGIYIAKVLSNTDEKQRERIFIRVIGVHNIEDNFTNKEFGIWSENANSTPYMSGYIPNVDAYVYVMFIKDSMGVYDTQRCVYFGEVRYNIS